MRRANRDGSLSLAARRVACSQRFLLHSANGVQLLITEEETAEAVAARLAREDARQAAKPKRPARDLAQGAGMHAAMGLADRRSVSNPSTASQPRRVQAERRAPSAPTRAGV